MLPAMLRIGSIFGLKALKFHHFHDLRKCWKVLEVPKKGRPLKAVRVFSATPNNMDDIGDMDVLKPRPSQQKFFEIHLLRDQNDF